MARKKVVLRLLMISQRSWSVMQYSVGSEVKVSLHFRFFSFFLFPIAGENICPPTEHHIHDHHITISPAPPTPPILSDPKCLKRSLSENVVWAGVRLLKISRAWARYFGDGLLKILITCNHHGSVAFTQLGLTWLDWVGLVGSLWLLFPQFPRFSTMARKSPTVID